MTKSRIQAPKQTDIAEAASKAEVPGIRWKTVGTVLAAFAILWLTSLMMFEQVGFWGVGAVGVLTLVAIGFGLYVWRMTRKQKEILNILKGASGEEGREAALQALAKGSGKDAMKALAHAQLVAQQDPQAGLEILEAIDIAKAPALVQDEVRAQRVMMYLFLNRPRDARPFADDIRTDKAPDKNSRAKYAALVAETMARTGNAPRGKELLSDLEGVDAGSELAPLVFRAQVYTYAATKNRGLARKAMDGLVSVDPNMVAPFMQKGVRPELKQIAQQALAAVGMAPKQQIKVRGR
mgnify:CR=1 FL=1